MFLYKRKKGQGSLEYLLIIAAAILIAAIVVTILINTVKDTEGSVDSVYGDFNDKVVNSTSSPFDVEGADGTGDTSSDGDGTNDGTDGTEDTGSDGDGTSDGTDGTEDTGSDGDGTSDGTDGGDSSDPEEDNTAAIEVCSDMADSILTNCEAHFCSGNDGIYGDYNLHISKEDNDCVVKKTLTGSDTYDACVGEYIECSGDDGGFTQYNTRIDTMDSTCDGDLANCVAEVEQEEQNKEDMNDLIASFNGEISVCTNESGEAFNNELYLFVYNVEEPEEEGVCEMKLTANSPEIGPVTSVICRFPKNNDQIYLRNSIIKTPYCEEEVEKTAKHIDAIIDWVDN